MHVDISTEEERERDPHGRSTWDLQFWAHFIMKIMSFILKLQGSWHLQARCSWYKRQWQEPRVFASMTPWAWA